MKSKILPFRVRIGASLTLILAGVWWLSKTDHAIVTGSSSPMVATWMYFLFGTIVAMLGFFWLTATLVWQFRTLRKARHELFLARSIRQTDQSVIALAKFEASHRQFCRLDNWLLHRARLAAAARRDWEVSDRW